MIKARKYFVLAISIAFVAALLVLPNLVIAETAPDYSAGFYDYEPEVNENGWLTWVREDKETGRQEIFWSNGLETKQISTATDSMAPSNPMINSKGWVTFQAVVESRSEVFLFDGDKTVQLTSTQDNRDNGEAAINDNGWVAWQSGSEHDNSSMIFLYDGSSIRQLSDSRFTSRAAQISNNGSVIWLGYNRESSYPIVDNDVFLWDGKQTTRLSNGGDNGCADINDKGQVAWSGTARGIRNEIWLYNGTETIQLTDNDDHDAWPQINNNGSVSWFRMYDRAPGIDVFMYNGVETKQLTAGTLAGYGGETQINDKGWVVWSGGSGVDPYGNYSEVYLYDGVNVIQLTNNDFYDRAPRINNIGWDPTSYPDAQVVTLLGRNFGVRAASTLSSARHDDTAPKAGFWTPKISSAKSKTRAFKIKWKGADPSALVWETRKQGAKNLALAGSSGIKSYTVQVRPLGSSIWQTLKSNTTLTNTYFLGRPGRTYHFRVGAKDNAGNIGWSKAARTSVPYDEEKNIYKRSGFKGYYANLASKYFLGSVRYSRTAGHTIVYKLTKARSIGLVTTKGPDRGRARIYVNGKYVTTVDARANKRRFRSLIFERQFKREKTIYLKIVNEGTQGRPRFDVDGVVALRRF